MYYTHYGSCAFLSFNFIKFIYSKLLELMLPKILVKYSIYLSQFSQIKNNKLTFCTYYIKHYVQNY